METKKLAEEKPYLKIDELGGGDKRLSLFLPPFDLDSLKAGFKMKLTLFFSKRKLQQMKKEFAKHNSVVVYVDGACLNNPGPAAGGACFFGKTVAPNEFHKENQRE